MLNPAPARPLLADLLVAGRVLLTPNALEAETLSGEADPERAAGALQARTGAPVLVTLGGAGALLVDGDAATALPAPAVEVVDTTGARRAQRARRRAGHGAAARGRRAAGRGGGGRARADARAHAVESAPPWPAHAALRRLRWRRRPIALDQPETRNALSDEVLDDLLAAFEAARTTSRPLVVLASTHEMTFSSAATSPASPPTSRWCQAPRTRAVPPPVRAHRPARQAVRAPAAGTASRARSASRSRGPRDRRARRTFGTPEINVGVFPFIIMALIFRNVPRKKAAELLLGERIDAAEAERSGSSTASAGGGVRRGGRRTGRAARGEVAVLMRLGKDAMFRSQDMALDDALDFLRAQLTVAFSTEDIQEGVQAFFDKREPVWKGR